MEEKQEKKSSKDAVYITIILLMMAGAGYLGYEFGAVKKQLATCQDASLTLQKDKDNLNQILKNTGLIAEADNQTLKENLIGMLSDYESLESTNQGMQDSIDAQKSKITALLTEVEELNTQNKKDWGKIYKLKKETETLREIMKGYIHTIDSLHTLNQALKGSIIDKDNQITEINKNLDDVKNNNDKLKETVAIGSVLQSTGFTAYAIKVKSNGTQSETNRANRANQIKGCITILENKIAKAENKTLYMRVIEPSGADLFGEKPVYFQMGEMEGKACIGRKVNYQNENLDVCIYYELEKEIEKGTYLVEIYCEGARIGKTSFALK